MNRKKQLRLRVLLDERSRTVIPGSKKRSPVSRAKNLSATRSKALASTLSVKEILTLRKKLSPGARAAAAAEAKRAGAHRDAQRKALARTAKSIYIKELNATVFDRKVSDNLTSYAKIPKNQRQTAQAYEFLVRAYKSVLSTPQRKDIGDNQQNGQRQVVIRLLTAAGGGLTAEGSPIT